MNPSEDSLSEQSTLDMETEGFGEHSIQNLNVTAVTNTFPINSGQVKEKELGKEGINKAYQDYRRLVDSGNVKRANGSEGMETYVSQTTLKVNKPHVTTTFATRAPNNLNPHSYEFQTNPHDVPNLYQGPISNIHP